MQIFKKNLLEFIKKGFDLFNLLQLLCIPPLKIVWNIESFKKCYSVIVMIVWFVIYANVTI